MNIIKTLGLCVVAFAMSANCFAYQYDIDNVHKVKQIRDNSELLNILIDDVKQAAEYEKTVFENAEIKATYEPVYDFIEALSLYYSSNLEASNNIFYLGKNGKKVFAANIYYISMKVQNKTRKPILIDMMKSKVQVNSENIAGYKGRAYRLHSQDYLNRFFSIPKFGKIDNSRTIIGTDHNGRTVMYDENKNKIDLHSMERLISVNVNDDGEQWLEEIKPLEIKEIKLYLPRQRLNLIETDAELLGNFIININDKYETFKLAGKINPLKLHWKADPSLEKNKVNFKDKQSNNTSSVVKVTKKENVPNWAL